MEGIEVLTVSEFNNRARSILRNEPALNRVWISGEISNLTDHSSGHCYFTLKDGGSEIRCTLFRGSRRNVPFQPEESMKVIAFGDVDIWVKRGAYQFNIVTMKPAGVGELYLAYERMKKRLETEGLFDSSHKKPLPKYPWKVGVVTSPTGAAIRDILNVTGRRFPADILIAPALVQGEGAKESIASGIRMLDGKVDVIIIGRGGGSIEDLWAFNEEMVARAIYECGTPIISAVGHETDFTIADFVSDKRAPTPSAAAEIAVPDGRQVMIRMDSDVRSMGHRLERNLKLMSLRCQRGFDRLEPKRALDTVHQSQQWVDALSDRMAANMSTRMKDLDRDVKLLSSRLDAASPHAALNRGYCFLRNGDGELIRSIGDVKVNDVITVTVADGEIESEVREVIPDGIGGKDE